MLAKCSNNRCGEDIPDDLWIPLCPSCRWVGKRCLAIGMLIGGAIIGAWRAW